MPTAIRWRTAVFPVLLPLFAVRVDGQAARPVLDLQPGERDGAPVASFVLMPIRYQRSPTPFGNESH